MNMETKHRLAWGLVGSRNQTKECRRKLLVLMEDDETFDFQHDGRKYRCWKRPAMKMKKPRLDKVNMTFEYITVEVPPSIRVIRLGKREKKNG